MESLELEIKCYLIDLYNPEICFDMPSNDDERVSAAIKNDDVWVSFIKNRFTVDDYADIYIKTMQIGFIRLLK